MNEIQERQDRRDQLLKEADQLHTQMLPFEAALEMSSPLGLPRSANCATSTKS